MEVLKGKNAALAVELPGEFCGYPSDGLGRGNVAHVSPLLSILLQSGPFAESMRDFCDHHAASRNLSVFSIFPQANEWILSGLGDLNIPGTVGENGAHADYSMEYFAESSAARRAIGSDAGSKE